MKGNHFVIWSALAIIFFILIFLVKIMILNNSDIQYYDWNLTNTEHPSKSIAESKKRENFIFSYQITTQILDSHFTQILKFKESWLELTKLYPEFLKKEDITTKQKIKYSIILIPQNESFMNDKSLILRIDKKTRDLGYFSINYLITSNIIYCECDREYNNIDFIITDKKDTIGILNLKIINN